MSLSVQHLLAGIAYWRTTSWPADFHHGFYQQMADFAVEANAKGNFNQAWRECFIGILGRWKANRPKSRAYLIDRLQKRAGRLSAAWKKQILPCIHNQDISTAAWRDVGDFTKIVAEVKDVSSPVFTSKFCHFLAPHIFPVIDNKAMGNPFASYQEYYETGQRLWDSTPKSEQAKMIKCLKEKIGGKNIYANYPFECKIIELCFIGRHAAEGTLRKVK